MSPREKKAELPEEEEFSDDSGIDEIFGVDDELDLSDAGIVAARFDFDITDVALEATENGKSLRITFENKEAVDFPIKMGLWLQHSSEKAQQIGRGQIKRLGKVALGEEKFAPSALVGCSVSAVLYENEDGFANVKNFRKAEGEPEEVAD
jgi:hypothetical protein